MGNWNDGLSRDTVPLARKGTGGMICHGGIAGDLDTGRRGSLKNNLFFLCVKPKVLPSPESQGSGGL